MANITDFCVWLDDVDGDHEEVMASSDAVQNVSDMGVYKCVEGNRRGARITIRRSFSGICCG
ncbi:hypothetical protein CBT70_004942 [Salmonella enterica]|nr:hypothetical protein [Salmonella enterica]